MGATKLNCRDDEGCCLEEEKLHTVEVRAGLEHPFPHLV